MARLHGKDWSTTVNAVEMGTTGQTSTVNVPIDTAEVTAAADSSKEYLEGDYGWDASIDGYADFGAGLSDDTLFGFIGSGEQAYVWKADDGAVSATNPSYSGNVILTSYSLTAGVGDGVTFSARLTGNGDLSRATG